MPTFQALRSEWTTVQAALQKQMADLAEQTAELQQKLGKK